MVSYEYVKFWLVLERRFSCLLVIAAYFLSCEAFETMGGETAILQ